MSIEQICKTISNLFNNVRPPYPQLNRLLMLCSMIRRPGLSVIQSVANITKDLNKLGIPTGSMPDGSANLTVAFTFANTKEYYRGIKHDMTIQTTTQPGSASFVGTGTNGGGAMVVKGTLVNTPFGVGIAK